MTPLTNPAVSAMALEKTTLALMQEFLANYFDGQPHDVGANEDVPFPLVELKFQQSAVTQPLDAGPGVSITMVWNEGSGNRKFWTPWTPPATGGTPGPPELQETAFTRVSWNFWVRANGTNAKANARAAADALSGLLGNVGETRALAQKGIHRVRSNAPRAVADSAYSLRLVTATAMLRYPILSQV
ncbi:MAG: hypothetical protein ABSE16_01505 [Verrucomicrobiota bacterium]|jgi:hypothetical protein